MGEMGPKSEDEGLPANMDKNGNSKGSGGGGQIQQRKYYCSMRRPLTFRMHNWNRFWLGSAHIFGIQGLFMIILGIAPRTAIIPTFLLGYFSGIGITVGCHRLWAHRTFKAKFSLQILLAYAQTMAAQYPIFKWCRDHRIHHKYTETTADPHNATRGFWFAHMGWLLEKPDKAIYEKEATLDLSDLDNDPIVRFQTKYYWVLLVISVYIVPISIFHWLYPELSGYELFCVNYVWYLIGLHFTWLVNSAAHLHGVKPYDTRIYASENPLVSLLAVGEGWHNYHHTFPWDYKTSELGMYGRNWSSLFIDTFAWLGLAYDLKTVPEEVVRARVRRTGNVSVHEQWVGKLHPVSENGSGDEGVTIMKEEKQLPLPPWGWGDADIPDDHFNVTQTLRPSKAA